MNGAEPGSVAPDPAWSVVDPAIVRHWLEEPALPEAALPEAALPEAALPEAALPEAALPEAALPEAALPEAALPEAAPPEAALPEAALPEAALPEAALPEAALPEAAPHAPGPAEPPPHDPATAAAPHAVDPAPEVDAPVTTPAAEVPAAALSEAIETAPIEAPQLERDAAPEPAVADAHPEPSDAPIAEVGPAEAALQEAEATLQAGEPAAAIHLLREAAAQFPHEPAVAHALAQAGASVGDWHAAADGWRLVLEHDPAEIEAHAGLVAALRAQGDAAAAEAALAAAVAAVPTDRALGIDYARTAEERGDWPAAAERWRRLALAVPDAPDGLYGHATALQRLGYGAEAQAVLADLVARFPGHASALHDLARLAEQQHDWAMAERCWRDFHLVDTGNWWSHSALAAAVRQQGRPEDAETILHAALSRFPEQPSLLADQARIAESRDDWAEAIRRWDDVIARFPDIWIGYGGKIAALARTGKQDAADAALRIYAPLLPDDTSALHDLARYAERQQDWPAAEAAWRGFLRHEAHVEWAHLGLVQALIRQDRLAEAAAVLDAAMQRLPGNPALTIEAARLSERRDLPQAAAAYWRDVARLLPAAAVGAIGEARVLASQGNTVGADAVIAAALARLPDEPALHEAHADTAIAAGDPRAALARLQAGQQRFPSHPGFAPRIEQIETRLVADAENPDLADPDAEAEADRVRALLLDFESLGGGGGQGGAFATFQDAHGAEPLGLLRWAEALPDELAEALEADFAGVGTAAQTDIAVSPDATPAHYRITDRRFGIAMPSFIAAAETPPDAARRLIEQRLSMLRGKLLDDLRAGTRIFVYTHGKRTLTASELDRLYAACRRYGDATLLYLRYADARHPAGTVAWDRPGLLIGSLGDPPEAADAAPPSPAALLTLCQRAHALWLDRPAGGPQAPAAPGIATTRVMAGA